MLFDQFGRKIEKTKTPERRALAAAPIMDSWREYVTAGLTPANLAGIFREADAGDMRRQSELFEQIEEKDGHLLGEKGKRVNIIQSAEFKTTPASEDVRDVKIAEFVQNYFDGMTDFGDNLICLQDAVGKGYAALEIKWDISEGQALPDAFEFIEQKRFLFYADGCLRRTPLLIDDNNTMGAEIPAWKVLFHKYGGKSGHPVRSGIYRVCAWNFLFKNYAVKDWVIFCEVYGMPLRLGKYDAGASDADREALYTAIASLGSDAAGIISKSTEIEFVEAARGKASGDLYQAMAYFSNREMSKALLGQTLSAEVGDKGSYAAAKTHEGVRIDLLKADITAAAATLRNQLIRPIVGFNFGWDTPCPEFEAVWEEPEDLKVKSDWVCSLLDRNVEMPLSFVRREFNIPEPEKGETVLGTPAQTVSQTKNDILKYMTAKNKKSSKRSFTAGQQALENLADEVLPDAIADLKKNEEILLKAVTGAQSYEDAMHRALEAYPEMNMDDFAVILERVMLNTGLFGRFEVRGES